MRNLSIKAELELSTSALSQMGTIPAGEPCVLRVRTSSQRLKIRVSLDDTDGEVSKTQSKESVITYSEALMCSVRMYAFQNGRPLRTFCILDYVGEVLLLNVVSNAVDFLFISDSSSPDTRQILQRARLVVRSADEPSKNLTDNVTTAVSTPVTTANKTPASTDATEVKRSQTRSTGDVLFIDLIILSSFLVVLMGCNILIVFCIKKFWEYRYGTAGIYRGTEGGSWTEEEDEEEPSDWEIKVEYSSDSFSGMSPLEREMAASVPQAEMTDLELFRSMYGVSGHPKERNIEREERHTESDNDEASVPSDGGENSNGSLMSSLRVSDSKTKKRVSFSDDIGKPLHVHSDASPEDEGEAPKPRLVEHSRPASVAEELAELSGPAPIAEELVEPSQPAPVAEEVRITVPFSGESQSPPTTDNGDSDSEEDTEQSSCCDSSSSSSYHEDDDTRQPEPGLLHELTRCFRRKPDNEPSEI